MAKQFNDETCVFMSIDDAGVDGLMYTALKDETLRLRACRSVKERECIRRFILEGFEKIKQYVCCQENAQTDKQE